MFGECLSLSSCLGLNPEPLPLKLLQLEVSGLLQRGLGHIRLLGATQEEACTWRRAISRKPEARRCSRTALQRMAPWQSRMRYRAWRLGLRVVGLGFEQSS